MADPSGSARSAAAPSTKTVRKTAKLLEVTPDESLRQAIELLDDVYADRELPSSSSLRGDLDGRLLTLHTQFMKQFAVVNAQFTEVCAGVDQLAADCGAARRELNTLEASSRNLMSTADMLQAEVDEIHHREEQVTRFMQQFQLSREETDALKDDVGPNFVAVLKKVQRIHASCKTMVLPEQQQAAIEIQESMYLAQVAGVEKLTRHVVQHVADLFTADVPEVSEFVVSALSCLHSNAGAWDKTMMEIARVRRTAIVRRFMNRVASTTTTSVSGRGRRAMADTDVVRLVSDLCAWIHQAVAEDTDALTPIFDSVDSSTVATISKSDVLDQIFEGVVKPMREKVQQSLVEAGCTSAALAERADPQSVLTLFKLEGMLGFYLTTTESLLGTNAALTECLRTLRLDALRVFLDGLQVRMRKVSNMATVVSSDLGVPNEVQDVLNLLRSMMEHMTSSFVPHQQREVDFAPVLGAVVDPLVSLSENAQLPGTITSEQRPNARDIYRINVMCAVLAVVLPFDFTSAKQAKLTSSLEGVLVEFSERNAAELVGKFGITSRLNDLRAGTVDEHALRETASSLFAYIYNTESLSVPLLDSVHVLRIRDRLRGEVTRVVCDAYESLHTEAGARMPAATRDEVLYHSPHQLRALLDAEGATTAAEAPAGNEPSAASL